MCGGGEAERERKVKGRGKREGERREGGRGQERGRGKRDGKERGRGKREGRGESKRKVPYSCGDVPLMFLSCSEPAVVLDSLGVDAVSLL